MFNSDLDVFSRLGFAQTADRIREELQKKDEEIKKLRTVLKQIAAWDCFPETGYYNDPPANTRPMSYEAAYGSNGTRDYMRQMANTALGENHAH